MPHNARKEDYQRLGLRFVRGLDDVDPLAAAKSFASFGQRFAQDRDSLPQTDADRAFHLVSLATDAIDYELPFATGDKAAELVAKGRQLLDEAVALDPDCFDAVRMLSSTRLPSVSERYEFLKSEEPRVRERCEAQRDSLLTEDPDRYALAADIAMRPYLRWVASMAEDALICGRNRLAAAHAEHLLEVDPHDMSDARFTLALAYTKLEDEAAFDGLAGRYRQICPTRGSDDAWLLICRIAFAHKRHNHVLARTELSKLLSSYRSGAVALIRQNELPDGEFARLMVNPYSEDELVIALSEAVVLLQEGNDPAGKGVLGRWLAANTARLRPKALEEAQKLEEQLRAQYGDAAGAGGPGAPGTGEQKGGAR